MAHRAFEVLIMKRSGGELPVGKGSLTITSFFRVWNSSLGQLLKKTIQAHKNVSFTKDRDVTTLGIGEIQELIISDLSGFIGACQPSSHWPSLVGWSGIRVSHREAALPLSLYE